MPKTVIVSAISALLAGALVCCAGGSPAVKRVEAVACADLAAVQALTITVEQASGASQNVIDATRTAFVALAAICSTSGAGSGS